MNRKIVNSFPLPTVDGLVWLVVAGLAVAAGATAVEVGPRALLAFALIPFLLVVWGIVRWRPAGLLVALLLATLMAGVLRQFTLAGSESGNVRLAGVVVLALLIFLIGLWIVQYLMGRDRFVIRCAPAVFGLFVLFISLNLLALLGGIMRYGLFAALVDADWLLWLGFFLLITRDPNLETFKNLAAALYGVSLFHSIAGIVRLVQGRGTIFLTTGGERYIPSSTSLLVASGFILSVILLFFMVKSKKARLLVLGLALIQVIGIVISFNRQMWVALTISLALGFLLFFRGYRVRLLAVAAAAVATLYVFVSLASLLQLFPVDLQDILARRLGNGQVAALVTDPSVQFRFAAWETAGRGIAERPLLGQGWGAPFSFSFVVSRSNTLQTFNSSPHNTYLWLAYKAGIPTLVLFLLFIFTLLGLAWLRYRQVRSTNTTQAALLIGAFLIELVYLIGALWWDYFSVMYMSVPIWINTGILAALAATSPTRSEPSP